MTITPQQKILSVLQLIEEIRQLGIYGKPVVIEENDLEESKISPEDFSRIIDKFVAEKLISKKVERAIQVDGSLTYQYEIKIPNESAFKKYAEKTHIEVHSGAEYLQAENFLAVADVLYDVYGKLQTADDSLVTIPIVPDLIRFPLLMPANTPEMFERYSNYRKEAVEYLKNRGTIVQYQIMRGQNRFDGQMELQVKRIAFQNFYDHFAPIYENRVDVKEMRAIAQGQKHPNNKPTVSESVKESLKGKIISFDAEKAKLCIGDKECQLPPYKNEHYLCKIMFQHPVDEPVEWQDVYDAMARSIEKYSEKVKDTKENRRPVYDAMLAVNGRIKELLNTDDDFLRWQEKTVIRKF